MVKIQHQYPLVPGTVMIDPNARLPDPGAMMKAEVERMMLFGLSAKERAINAEPLPTDGLTLWPQASRPSQRHWLPWSLMPLRDPRQLPSLQVL